MHGLGQKPSRHGCKYPECTRRWEGSTSEGNATEVFDFPIFLLARLITSDLQWYFLAIHNSLLSYDTPCLPPNFVQPLVFFLFLLGNSVFRRPQINLGILISYIVSSLIDWRAIAWKSSGVYWASKQIWPRKSWFNGQVSETSTKEQSS